MSNRDDLRARLDAMVNEILDRHFGVRDSFVCMEAYREAGISILSQLDAALAQVGVLREVITKLSITDAHERGRKGRTESAALDSAWCAVNRALVDTSATAQEIERERNNGEV